jgi:hypothetical protein
MCDDGQSAGVLKQFIPSLIEPGLYLGSIASEQETEVLQSLGVTHVLSLTTGFSPTAPSVCRVKKITTKFGVVRCDVLLNNSAEVPI